MLFPVNKSLKDFFFKFLIGRDIIFVNISEIDFASFKILSFFNSFFSSFSDD